jgi:putative transposase
MAKVEHYITRFEEGEFYHVYNRCIDRKLLFKSDENNLFFLRKFHFYLDPVSTAYAYCLLENHFHFLVRIPENLDDYRIKNQISPSISTHDIISKQFRRFFQCYALSFNKQHERCGTLFQTPFKRVRVKSNQYLIYLVYYIHSNPQKHGLIPDLKNWKWSSYNEILENDNTLNQEIIQWFGDKKAYINFHTNNFDNL